MQDAKETQGRRAAAPRKGERRKGNADLASRPRREEVADYLARILPELTALAERAEMDVVGYLLRMAEDEARSHLQRGGDEST